MVDPTSLVPVLFTKVLYLPEKFPPLRCKVRQYPKSLLFTMCKTTFSVPPPISLALRRLVKIRLAIVLSCLTEPCNVTFRLVVAGWKRVRINYIGWLDDNTQFATKLYNLGGYVTGARI